MNEHLAALLAGAKRAVFFGGAGVSTESGIPDFRSADGLYSDTHAPVPPEEVLHHDFFMRHTADFYDFYRAHMLFPGAKPNAAHLALAALESQGKLAGVITQNIDGLHQAAGSKKVLELHGSVLRNTCMRCGKHFGLDAVTGCTGVPKCSCGGTIKPDVVLYGESLDESVLDESVSLLTSADLLIIGGTSLSVYPAAGLVGFCRGKTVVINKTPTHADSEATLLIREPIGEAMRLL